MSNLTINVATDFSRYPAGRYVDDGPYSGEAFRNQLLIPALNKGTVLINLDGVRGYGSSFLEEAFGGLVRNGFSVEHVQNNIELNSKDEYLIEEIREYIKNGGVLPADD